MIRGARTDWTSIACLLLASFAGTSGLPKTALAQSSAELPEQQYDISPQPLDAALARYAQISHVDIIYDDTLAEGRRSASVQGSFTPQQALARLLSGTGLSSRFTRSSAALIFAAQSDPADGQASDSTGPVLTLHTMQVRAAPIIGSAPRALFDTYARGVLSIIDRELRPSAIADRRLYRASIRLWVGQDGKVLRAEFDQQSGHLQGDVEVLTGITGLQFDRPPPDMPQPIRVQLEAR